MRNEPEIVAPHLVSEFALRQRSWYSAFQSMVVPGNGR